MDHVYVMRDPSNHNVVKIGFSIDPLKRRQQLYNTSTPLPFDIYTVWAVSDHRIAEKIAHAILDNHRINNRREWFEIAPKHTEIWYQGIQGDYDTTSVYLYHLCEQIEDAFRNHRIKFHQVTSLEELKLSIELEDISFLQ